MRAISGKDFAKLLERKGWELRRTRGSHHESRLIFHYEYLASQAKRVALRPYRSDIFIFMRVRCGS